MFSIFSFSFAVTTCGLPTLTLMFVESILVPVFTPMDDAGNINFQVIPQYMAHLSKQDINGIVVGGTTGEAMSLTTEERKALLETWVTAAKPLGIKVVAQIGGTALPYVFEMAKHAEYLKVDGIMTLPELYYKPKSVEQLVQYLKEVSDAAPKTPIIYYHFPMMTGVDVNMRQFFTLASAKIPNFKGAKADLAIAEQVNDILKKDQRVFIANHHLATSVLMGHDSSIATVSNIFPDLVKGIVNSIKNSDVKKANMLQRKLSELVDIISSQGDFVSSMKAAMEILTNIRMGPTKHPLTPLGQNQLTTLKNSLCSINI